MADKRTSSKTKNKSIGLCAERYGIALSWDNLQGRTDLDLQAIIVDCHGLIVDAVYHNNLYAMNGAIGHSGDERNGSDEGYDESIWVDLGRLPQEVQLVIFVVAISGEGTFLDIANGELIVVHRFRGQHVKYYKLERSPAAVDAMIMMRRRQRGGATPDSHSWDMVYIDEPAEAGSHFLDILEPTIGDIIRKEIRTAPRKQRVSFQMEKDASVDLPAMNALKRINIGIGGVLSHETIDDVDIDIAAVFYTKSGQCLGAVDVDESAEMYGVWHSGDKMAGEQVGDDEVITIDLNQCSAESRLEQIFLILTMRDDATFQSIASAYARLTDQSCAELARYDIFNGPPQAGLIIARIFRVSRNRWGVQALGRYCSARSWKKAKKEMKELCLHLPCQESKRKAATSKPKENRRYSKESAGSSQTGKRCTTDASCECEKILRTTQKELQPQPEPQNSSGAPTGPATDPANTGAPMQQKQPSRTQCVTVDPDDAHLSTAFTRSQSFECSQSCIRSQSFSRQVSPTSPKDWKSSGEFSLCASGWAPPPSVNFGTTISLESAGSGTMRYIRKGTVKFFRAYKATSGFQLVQGGQGFARQISDPISKPASYSQIFGSGTRAAPEPIQKHMFSSCPNPQPISGTPTFSPATWKGIPPSMRTARMPLAFQQAPTPLACQQIPVEETSASRNHTQPHGSHGFSSKSSLAEEDSIPFEEKRDGDPFRQQICTSCTWPW